jgi:hypothetical protein
VPLNEADQAPMIDYDTSRASRIIEFNCSWIINECQGLDQNGGAAALLEKSMPL